MAQPFELRDLGTGQQYVVERSGFYAGRSTQADLPLYDLDCSRRQFQFLDHEGRYYLEPLSESARTWCNGRMVDARVPVHDGMLIRAGRSRFRVCGGPPPAPRPSRGVRAEAAGPRGGGSAPPADGSRLATIPGFPVDAPPPPSDSLPEVIPLCADAIIGRAADAEVHLPHVQVSERHARIRQRPDSDDRIIHDLGSTNGTFVDGRRLVMPELLTPGARIGIGPYLLTYTGTALVPNSRIDNLQLEAVDLVREVPHRILDKVSLVVRPHEFVCLLGPTGSGKTTLLKALSAREPANEGSVLINQTNLYHHFEALKHDIAVVPQQDILHELLSLEDALRYTARLRLPVDTSTPVMNDRVAEMLAAVGLTQQRRTAISELSGGQRRRASLANELLANPSLLFLDEVTSGLDEQTDREMMRLFRRIAESGKTVVCVTHTLANIEECCHLVVLLTVGGKLAFIGTPREALDYFQIKRLGHVYEKLADPKLAESWQRRFRGEPLYTRYITLRRSAGPAPREDESKARGGKEIWRDCLSTFVHQLPLLTARYARVLTADRRALGGLALQVFVVALVMYLVFGDALEQASVDFRKAAHACNMLFVLSVSCFWFGCNNSAKEVVKERAIYTKELQVNLDPAAYLCSKLLLQFLIAALQSVVLLAIVAPVCALPGDRLAQGALLVLTAAAGVSVGLCISTTSTTEEMAVTLVPLVLIPQIILSEVFIQLEGIPQFLGQMCVTNYWAYGAMRDTLPDPLIHQLNAPLALPLSPHQAELAMGLHILLLFGAAILVIHVRDRVMASSRKSLREAVTEMPIVRLAGSLLGLRPRK